MPQIPPIDDNYIDEVIKSTGPYNEALNKTQGVKLRELIKKLRDYLTQEIQQGFNEQNFATIAERDAYNVETLPFQAFVNDDGDGNWALYRATTTGIGAAYVKISDPDLLNAVMSSEAIKAAYESNPDTNAFTDADKSKVSEIDGKAGSDDLLFVLSNDTIYDKRTFVDNVATNSNFIGFRAGYDANNASESNFFGNFAGYGATNAHLSNFFGPQAGCLATQAHNSVFFGKDAGNEATNADNSNFFGDGAGYHATTASQSNFLGYKAGYEAIDAYYSNFFGNFAGYGATNARLSNFFGTGAGRLATEANSSVFFGQDAGNEATNASGSNFFGPLSGQNAINASGSNFFGIGAGSMATNASGSNFFGAGAGDGAINANRSNFFGESAGTNATNASYSNLFGYKAGFSFSNNNIGANNIIIGTNISLLDGTTNAINLGGILFATGTYSNVDGTPSITPANGKIGINKVMPTAAFDVIGLLEYADNAAAVTAGLTEGAFYRTGDLLKIVH